MSDLEAAEVSSKEIIKFLKRIDLSQKLSDVNMPEDEIEALANQCMVLPDYKNNPKIATLDEMIALVKESY